MTETLCFEGINNFVIYVQPVYIIITSVIYIPHSSPSTYSKCKSPNNEVSSSPNSLNLQETSFNRQVGKISVAPQTILKQYRSLKHNRLFRHRVLYPRTVCIMTTGLCGNFAVKFWIKLKIKKFSIK